MKRKFYILILMLNFISFLTAKTVPDSLLNKKQKQSSIFLFTAGYRIPLNKSTIINSGHGIYLEGGLNLGRLVSKEHVLGIYVGYALIDRFWATSFNNNFSIDYNESISKEQNYTSLDSAVINVSSNLFKKTKGNDIAIPGCAMNSFHNYSLYYGTIIKLPFKHMPIIKFYIGSNRSHFQGDGYLATKGKEFNIFQLRRPMYGCELIILQLQNFKKNNPKSNSSNKNFGFSIYYQYCNFSNASLYFNDSSNTTNIPLKRFVNSNFLNKYKDEITWGCKLSFYII